MPNPILKAEHLVKRYGAFTAVDDISLEIYKGKILALLGPNGAGKTTTINMLAGLLPQDEGTVWIDSENPQQAIGICPQNIAIWENLTCKEQLKYVAQIYNLPSDKANKRAEKLLEDLGLSDKADTLAKKLSGGMQRRMNIALALVHDPAILILDEPQAGLDPQSRNLVREYIKSIKDKTTVLLTTHDMEEAEKLADEICIIDHGKIIAQGSNSELKKKYGEGEVIKVEIVGNIRTELIEKLGIEQLKDKNSKNEQKNYKIISESVAQIVAAKGQSPLALLKKITSIAEENKIDIKDISLREVSLEDIFLNLTGRSLRE